MAKEPTHTAFVVTGEDENGENGWFDEIGAGWAHGGDANKGITILLKAFPVNGKLVVLPKKAKPPREAADSGTRANRKR